MSSDKVRIRPATETDECHECGQPITNDVVEVKVSSTEVHFFCEPCAEDNDRSEFFVARMNHYLRGSFR